MSIRKPAKPELKMKITFEKDKLYAGKKRLLTVNPSLYHNEKMKDAFHIFLKRIMKAAKEEFNK